MSQGNDSVIEVKSMCEKYHTLVQEIITLNKEAEAFADQEQYREAIDKYLMIVKLLELAIELSDDLSLCTISNEDDIMNRLFCKKMVMQCQTFSGKIQRVQKIIQELELMERRKDMYMNETEITDNDVYSRIGQKQGEFANMKDEFDNNFAGNEDPDLMRELASEIPIENETLRNAIEEMTKRYQQLLDHCKKLHNKCQETINDDSSDSEDEKKKEKKKQKKKKKDKKNKDKNIKDMNTKPEKERNFQKYASDFPLQNIYNKEQNNNINNRGANDMYKQTNNVNQDEVDDLNEVDALFGL